MVSTIDVVRFLRNTFPDLEVFPIEIPLKAKDAASLVLVQGNSQVVAGVSTINVQIKVRDIHPALSEATSIKLRQTLENKTNFNIGDVQVILVKSQNPVPLYVGQDEKNRYLYSNNFRFLINEGGNK